MSIKSNRDLGLGILDHKGWGMALNNIWWACDIQRYIRPVCFVIEKRGDTTRKGFSAEQPETAEALLRKFVLM